jgi:hypothetical protein
VGPEVFGLEKGKAAQGCVENRSHRYRATVWKALRVVARLVALDERRVDGRAYWDDGGESSSSRTADQGA